LSLTTQLVHLAPADQPSGAHQIAAQLFRAYSVDGGRVHLAGCRLEDRPFLRFEFGEGTGVKTLYVDDTGEPLDGGLVQALGLGRVAELNKPPQRFEKLVERANRAVAVRAAERFASEPPAEPSAVAVVWVKHAEGKLRFTIGEASADLPFSGWACTLKPPPYVCPYSGQKTFHLAATDDGRIVAAEQLQRCQYTRRRVLAGELETCTATGRRVVREMMVTCPVTAARVMQTAMTTCRTCRQRVAPGAVSRGQCASCRDLQPVDKADPRMARLLDEHPVLDRWRGWRIAETATAYILTARGWLKRLLLVVDKESLELKHVGEGHRLSTQFTAVEPSQHAFVLRD